MSQSKQLSLFDDADHEPGSSEPHTDLENNKISFLALAEIKGVGFVTMRALFEAFRGNFTHVWDTDSSKLCASLEKTSIPQPKQIVQLIKDHPKELLRAARDHYSSLKRRNVEILFRDTVLYPQSLYHLKSPPMWLFVEGNIDILNDPSIVAVVGTREPTRNGLDAAKRLSILLVTRGCIILSGLAEGIDEVGHRTAVDYGSPTIAVLGHGIDVIYPAATSSLRQRIIEQGGAVISEYLPKDTYNRERFVQRNRIQAGLAKAVAVVEGRTKSGTAHTARFADELHRHIFGVRIGSPQNIPQQELLDDLMKSNYFVFALDNQEERDKLRKYLGIWFPIQLRKRAGHPQLFKGLVREVERLSQEYDATETDFDWLVAQIQAYRDNIGSGDEDGNKSGHP